MMQSLANRAVRPKLPIMFAMIMFSPRQAMLKQHLVHAVLDLLRIRLWKLHQICLSIIA